MNAHQEETQSAASRDQRYTNDPKCHWKKQQTHSMKREQAVDTSTDAVTHLLSMDNRTLCLKGSRLVTAVNEIQGKLCRNH